MKNEKKKEVATFAAGCFWGVQTLFDSLPGVISTRVGYTGGSMNNPSYKDVCSDRTGHAEAIEIVFDPKKTSFSKLLEIFWTHHDPTTLNRQGPDFGSQYRSAIFYHSQEQLTLAEKSKMDYQKKIKSKIVTEIIPSGKFYPAEEYHQKYLEKKGLASCHI